MSFHSFLIAKYDLKKDDYIELSVQELLPYIDYSDTRFTLKSDIKHNDKIKTRLEYVRKLQIEQNENIRRHNINDVKRLIGVDMTNWTLDKLIFDEHIIEMLLQKGLSFTLEQFNDIMTTYKIKIVGQYNSLYDYILDGKKQEIYKYNPEYIIDNEAFKVLYNTISLFSNVKKKINGTLDSIKNYKYLVFVNELISKCDSFSDSIENIYKEEHSDEDRENIIKIKSKYKNINIQDLVNKSSVKLKELIDIKLNKLQDYYGLFDFVNIIKAICGQCSHSKTPNIYVQTNRHQTTSNKINHNKSHSQSIICENCVSSVGINFSQYILEVFEFDYKINRPTIYNKHDVCYTFENIIKSKYNKLYTALVNLSVTRNCDESYLTRNMNYDSTKLFSKDDDNLSKNFYRKLFDNNSVRLQIIQDVYLKQMRDERNPHHKDFNEYLHIGLKKKYIDQMLVFPFEFDYRTRVYGSLYTELPTKNRSDLIPIFEQKLLDRSVFYDTIDNLFGDNIKLSKEIKEEIRRFWNDMRKIISKYDQNYEVNNRDRYNDWDYKIMYLWMSNIFKTYNDAKKMNDEASNNFTVNIKTFENLLCKFESAEIFGDVEKYRSSYDKLMQEYENEIHKKSTKTLREYTNKIKMLHLEIIDSYSVNFCNKIIDKIPNIEIPYFDNYFIKMKEEVYKYTGSYNTIPTSYLKGIPTKIFIPLEHEKMLISLLDICAFASKFIPLNYKISSNNSRSNPKSWIIDQETECSQKKVRIFKLCCKCSGKLKRDSNGRYHGDIYEKACEKCVNDFENEMKIFLDDIKSEHNVLKTNIKNKLKLSGHISQTLIDTLELPELEKIYSVI
jgi:hypothetical protein